MKEAGCGRATKFSDWKSQWEIIEAKDTKSPLD